MDHAVTTETVTTPRPPECREADIAALQAIAQAAVNVELFTIPLYMCAMTSIQGMHQITGKDETFYRGRLWPGAATTAHPKTPNEKAYNIIFSVFIEEMLHVQMAANLATRVGVQPTFTSPLLQNSSYGWTCYGPNNTVIPHIVDLRDTKNAKDVKVDIGPVDPAQMRLFRVIEQPEKQARENIEPGAEHKYFPQAPFPDWKVGMTEKDLPMFGTIGQMYLCYYDYLNLSYQDDPGTKLWEHVYDHTALQRDLFNVEKPHGHPEREFPGFDTTISRPSLRVVWDMISAITDQGEGGELPRPRPMKVEDQYQASLKALKADYPSFTDSGAPTDSRDATARYDNGKNDHYERFAEIEGLMGQDGFVTWPRWRRLEERPWQAADLTTGAPNDYNLPSPEFIAEAMNELGLDESMYHTISQAAVGSIAGITTVLNNYWADSSVLFPYPSMAGSGDRMAICWAMFRKAPDLSGGPARGSALLHACQGLDLTNRSGVPNDCAAVDVFHSCRGSNACKAQGGCGFVQNDSGGGSCGFALVKEKSADDPARDGQQTVYSAPGDNKCGAFGGCAVPISASQVLPQGGTMRLYDFVGENHNATPIGKLTFERGEKVHDVAYRAYQAVMEHRGSPVPPKPAPNRVRLAFPPST
ncbi:MULTISPECIES: ferritin-like domain-containing protein [unclassified Saccharothrix]|uniref:ferritin-like domain-containing protein n=1 Tax=unclassified Saccharothrix TaxID=2593673 RepID=UPI00307E094A